MTRINTNVPSLRGMRNLQTSNKVLNQSLQRLSTGLRINSGKDDPAGLIGSAKLRSQMTAIGQSIKNSNRANNVIATADGALGEIGSLLNQVRALVQEGLNDGALSQSEIEANQMQIDSALSAINRIAANTTFAGDKLIDGSKAFTTQLTTADTAELSDFQINEAVFGTSSTITVSAAVTQTAQKGELIYTTGTLSSAASVEISGSKGSQVVFLGSASTNTNIRDAINGVTDVTGVVAAQTAGADLTKAGSNNDLNFSDIRAAGTAGTVKVVLADPGAASQALSVTVTTSGNDKTVTVNLATDAASAITSTAAEVATAVNADATANVLTRALASEGDGSGVVSAVASTDLAGTAGSAMRLSSSNYGSKEFVDVNVLSGTFATVAAGSTTSTRRDAGRDISATINGQAASTDGLKASVKSALLDASLTFTTAANSTSTTTAVTITGGGALFQIGQEVSAAGQIGMGIEAVNTARLGGTTGKVYELGTGAGKSLLDATSSTSVQGSTLVDIITEAIDRVSTQRGRLGAIQKNIIETNVNSLGVALENITEARSAIVDTDFASETANLTRAQILQQAGTKVLAIANQNPANVLALLQ